MKTIRLTMAQAIIRFLKNQSVERDGQENPFFAGVWGIFGHGNVAGIGQALQQAGEGFDEVLLVRSDDLVLVPEGYHPVVSAPGYTSYYLNVLSGSAQALTAVDDPAHSWVKNSYRSRDPRVPIYPVDPEKII